MSKRIPDSIRDLWKERVIKQSQSDLSIAAWCRQNNFTPHTFYYWRDKLFPRTSLMRADFKEISEQPNVDTQSRKSGVCLQYQGFCIHLDQNFDMATLTKCLKSLKELPC